MNDQSLIDEWINWLTHDSPRKLAQATIDDYRRQLISFARWMEQSLGHIFQSELITNYRVEQYLAEIERQIYVGKRKPATYNKVVAVLSSFGSWLVQTGNAQSSPAYRIHSIPEQSSPIRTLDRRVIKRLLDAAHHTGDIRDAVVLELLAFSGMRSQELAGLKIENLEVGLRTTWVNVFGKARKHRRIPLPKSVGTLIQEYLQKRASREHSIPTSGPLLVGERGGITRTTINRIVARVAMNACLSAEERETITPHAFRHTVATHITRQHNLITAADLLGHSSLNTTRRYAKASAQELETAVESLFN